MPTGEDLPTEPVLLCPQMDMSPNGQARGEFGGAERGTGILPVIRSMGRRPWGRRPWDRHPACHLLGGGVFKKGSQSVKAKPPGEASIVGLGSTSPRRPFRMAIGHRPFVSNRQALVSPQKNSGPFVG